MWFTPPTEYSTTSRELPSSKTSTETTNVVSPCVIVQVKTFNCAGQGIAPFGAASVVYVRM
jgi:hypothetical protein